MEADVASAVQPAPVALIVASRLRLFACLLVHPPSPASCYACGCGCLRFVWDALAAVGARRRAQKRGVPTPIILLATVLQLRHLHVLTALHTRTQLGRRKLTHVVYAARAAPGLSKQTPAR